MKPKDSQAFLTDFSMLFPSALISSSTAMALGREEDEETLRQLISSQRDWSLSIRRAAAMTLQPALARSRQNSRPRPEEAPVTMTTLPWRQFQGSRWVGEDRRSSITWGEGNREEEDDWLTPGKSLLISVEINKEIENRILSFSYVYYYSFSFLSKWPTFFEKWKKDFLNKNWIFFFLFERGKKGPFFEIN